jgi:hypothetical protein
MVQQEMIMTELQIITVNELLPLKRSRLGRKKSAQGARTLHSHKRHF